MVTSAHAAKLLDFGIAALMVPSDAEALTTAGPVVAGTVGYMSPEQITNGPLDARSDVFQGVGAVLYEMLAGAPAFPGRTPSERLAAVLTLTPPALEDRGVDAALAAISLPGAGQGPRAPAGHGGHVSRRTAGRTRGRHPRTSELAGRAALSQRRRARRRLDWQWHRRDRGGDAGAAPERGARARRERTGGGTAPRPRDRAGDARGCHRRQPGVPVGRDRHLPPARARAAPVADAARGLHRGRFSCGATKSTARSTASSPCTRRICELVLARVAAAELERGQRTQPAVTAYEHYARGIRLARSGDAARRRGRVSCSRRRWQSSRRTWRRRWWGWPRPTR